MNAKEFIRKSAVDDIVDQLRKGFSEKNKTLNVSDLKDKNGNQYVDLVQEGGGVWGIALVGYTYVLEKMGIRFFSLAGTSAGSINSIMFACAGNKEDEKSEKIIQYLLELNMFDIVDGKKNNNRFTRFVKYALQRFLTSKNVNSRFINLLYWIILIIASLTIIVSVSGFLMSSVITRWYGLAFGIVIAMLVWGCLYTYKLFKEFCNHGYGLNEGNFFHQWINKKISENYIDGDINNGTINNMADFARHYTQVPKDLVLLPDANRPNDSVPSVPMLAIITTDITVGRKIEFPRMWDLYWPTLEAIHPGDFIRASMSIPGFFETYKITIKHIDEDKQRKAWNRHLNWREKELPRQAQFIDGGALSNFPISVFANPNYIVPRMPTFGVRLQRGSPDKLSDNKLLSQYVGSIVSTLRFNYDRDFINKNRSFSSGIKTVDLSEHNWLNFFMTDEEKIKIFRKGAIAAKEFLECFDWELYKKERKAGYDLRNTVDNDPNNFGHLQPYKSNV